TGESIDQDTQAAQSISLSVDGNHIATFDNFYFRLDDCKAVVEETWRTMGQRYRAQSWGMAIP
ncbi:MAG TPA: hypothetical protein VGM39_08525, partial [Kofleriaceae bacterium]